MKCLHAHLVNHNQPPRWIPVTIGPTMGLGLCHGDLPTGDFHPINSMPMPGVH
ncbi:hypothetical protein [Zooshikella sp. RANM57]|uniref:hypothetical protein n=1 Tax=Zooshikella sp. RANM57 TaxID=3425863 RepID=UPI003D6F30C8